MNRRFLTTGFATLIWAIFAIGPVSAEVSTAKLNEVIDTATRLAAEADRLGMLWSVWDKAGDPEDSTPIDKLLDIAREKQAAGDLDEAMRLATMVAKMAEHGIEQGRQPVRQPLFTQ